MIFFRASTPAPYKNLAYNQTKQTGKAAKSLISKGGSAAAFLQASGGTKRSQAKKTVKAAKSLISKDGSAAAFLRYPPPSNLTTNYQQGPEIPGLVASGD